MQLDFTPKANILICYAINRTNILYWPYHLSCWKSLTFLVYTLFGVHITWVFSESVFGKLKFQQNELSSCRMYVHWDVYDIFVCLFQYICKIWLFCTASVFPALLILYIFWKCDLFLRAFFSRDRLLL